jgi:hypothetical protein
VAQKYQKGKTETSASTVPEQVSVALGELVGEVGEGLLALAVGTGGAGVDRDDGGRRDRGVRAEGPP